MIFSEPPGSSSSPGLSDIFELMAPAVPVFELLVGRDVEDGFYNSKDPEQHEPCVDRTPIHRD